MSIFNDHRRCLELLDSEDDKRKLVSENMRTCTMTFGKHKGKYFKDIFVNDQKYVWWVCNKASLNSPTIKLFKRYCEKNKTDAKSVKPVMNFYVKNNYEIPERVQMRAYDQVSRCRHCEEYVNVKETIHGHECSVCGFEM